MTVAHDLCCKMTSGMSVQAVSVKRKRGRAALVLVAVVLLTLLLYKYLGLGIGRSIHYVVPDGFRGPLYIVGDSDYDDPPVEDGKYVFRFPESGVLIVNNVKMFNRWHSSTAEWSSGETLFWGLDPSPQVVAFRGGSMSAYRSPNGDMQWRMNNYVGTEAEFLARLDDEGDPLCPPLAYFYENGIQAE